MGFEGYFDTLNKNVQFAYAMAMFKPMQRMHFLRRRYYPNGDTVKPAPRARRIATAANDSKATNLVAKAKAALRTMNGEYKVLVDRLLNSPSFKSPNVSVTDPNKKKQKALPPLELLVLKFMRAGADTAQKDVARDLIFKLLFSDLMGGNRSRPNNLRLRNLELNTNRKSLRPSQEVRRAYEIMNAVAKDLEIGEFQTPPTRLHDWRPEILAFVTAKVEKTKAKYHDLLKKHSATWRTCMKAYLGPKFPLNKGPEFLDTMLLNPSLEESDRIFLTDALVSYRAFDMLTAPPFPYGKMTARFGKTVFTVGNTVVTVADVIRNLRTVFDKDCMPQEILVRKAGQKQKAEKHFKFFDHQIKKLDDRYARYEKLRQEIVQLSKYKFPGVPPLSALGIHGIDKTTTRAIPNAYQPAVVQRLGGVLT